MSIAMKVYDYTMPAGGSFVIYAQGSYFRIASTLGAVSVTVEGTGTIGPLLAGQGMKDQAFQRLVITDTSGAGNAGSIIIADASFVNDRTTGEVSVTDGTKARTMSGAVFGAGMLVFGVAGNLSVAQLWNPPGSGKRLIVPAVSISCGSVSISQYVGVMTASIGGTDASASSIRSNYSNGPASVAQARYNNMAAAPFNVYNWRAAGNLGALNKHQPVQGPYVLEPGSGLTAFTGTAGAEIYVSFEYQEDPL